VRVRHAPAQPVVGVELRGELGLEAVDLRAFGVRGDERVGAVALVTGALNWKSLKSS
jgi:hypothetical protein